jgi:hypothetical protein
MTGEVQAAINEKRAAIRELSEAIELCSGTLCQAFPPPQQEMPALAELLARAQQALEQGNQ